MRTLFFYNWSITSAGLGESRFGHSFGGPPAHRGARRENCQGRLLHLLHHINLADPAIGLEVAGIQWLPLYYCFDFRVNALGYRLLSDHDVQVYFWHDEANVSDTEQFPDDDYPTEFPRRPIALDRFAYDPTDREDAYRMAGIFGIERLSAEDRRWVLEQEAESFEETCGYRAESEEELLESFSHPFVQGPPNSRCPNPDCPNHTVPGNLRVIAMMPAEPVPGVHTFGRWGGGARLIFELCPQCHTIHVSNEST